MTPLTQHASEAELNERLPDHLKPRLEQAVIALLDEGDQEPLDTFLREERAEAQGSFPDVWRHAAMFLYNCRPEQVTQKMRFAVKHGCFALLRMENPHSAAALQIRSLLLGLQQPLVAWEAPTILIENLASQQLDLLSTAAG